MVYMGSKSKFKKEICPILQKIIDDNGVKTYIECFVGGCNIIDSIRCENKYGYDKSETLIALLKQASENFDDVLKDCDKELWFKAKEYSKTGVPPEGLCLADVGAAEFLGSYGAGGFSCSFANPCGKRNYYNERYRNLQKQAPMLKGIHFECQNYQDLAPVQNALIYLDPPYQGTRQYRSGKFEKMDYTFFWDWVRKLSLNNYVVVSEQNAPDDFECIWEKKAKRLMSAKNNFEATEKLFVFKDGLK